MHTIQTKLQDLATRYKTLTPETMQRRTEEPTKNMGLDEVLDDENKERVDKILKIKDTFKTLIITGPTGVGKTYTIKKLFPTFYFCREADFKQKLVAGQLVLRSNEEFGCDVGLFPLEALLKKQGIIYDDYGVSEPTVSYNEKMMYRLDRVDHQGKQTIITTNMSVKDMKLRDERIRSRIMQNCMILEIQGKDRRVKNTIIL